mmetsp:Transcript_2456/g.5596  ORF Transcript_2456/g.5596 Transcript_2456/m.5596 type:complete len:124 (+) Transcript_2456:149-520(+)
MHILRLWHYTPSRKINEDAKMFPELSFIIIHQSDSTTYPHLFRKGISSGFNLSKSAASSRIKVKSKLLLRYHHGEATTVVFLVRCCWIINVEALCARVAIKPVVVLIRPSTAPPFVVVRMELL